MNNILQEMDLEYSDSLPEVKVSYECDLDYNVLPQITSPDEAYQQLKQIWDMGTLNYREEFVILLLNNTKKCIGWSKISIGGATAAIVDPAKIYQVALITNAHSILLAHNHPSGNMKASSADINLTKRLKEVGKIHGISVEDHLIITSTGYLSLRSQGLM